MDGQLTLEDISKALEIDTELSQNEAINPKDDRKKYYELRDLITSEYNINFILIYNNFKYTSNGNTKIDLSCASCTELKQLYRILNINNFVCVYSKLHCLGIIKTAGNLQRFKFIKTAIDDNNGFQKCDRIHKCKMIDITDFTIDLDSNEIETLIVTDYDSYHYSLDRKSNRKNQFLQALMYEDIRENN